jgi:hypothetical protein
MVKFLNLNPPRYFTATKMLASESWKNSNDMKDSQQTEFTSIQIQALNQRIQLLEASVMDLRIPWYVRYKIHIRVICFICMIPVLIGVYIAFTVDKK